MARHVLLKCSAQAIPHTQHSFSIIAHLQMAICLSLAISPQIMSIIFSFSHSSAVQNRTENTEPAEAIRIILLFIKQLEEYTTERE